MTTDMQPKTTQAAPEILREELPMQRFVGAGLSQAVVEGEVALPGGLREETSVLLSQAMAVLDHGTAENGRVTADGRVTFHILYTQGDPTKVNALEAGAEFTHHMDVPGAQAGMSAPVSLMVEHVEASAQGGRIRLMAIVRVYARVFSDEPVAAVTGIRGVEGLMVKTETLKALRVASSGQQDVFIRDECELGQPLQITDTLCASAIATVHEVMGGGDRASIAGQVDLEVTHVSDMPSRPVIVTRHSIPFEESIALSGDMGDQLIGAATVRDVAVISQEGQDGERTLRAEVLLGLSARSTSEKEVALLLDAYTTQGDKLVLTSQQVSRAGEHRQIRTAESGKLNLILDGQPPVRTPLRAALTPIITDLSRLSGKLVVEGMMDVTLLYMTDEEPAPQSWRTEEPFRMVFACDPALPEAITLTPGNVDVSAVTSDRVEVKFILHLDCADVQLMPQELVAQVAAVPGEEVPAGVLVCFAQPGETLWDIARRYRVSTESLRKMNPGLSDPPDRVLLYRG